MAESFDLIGFGGRLLSGIILVPYLVWGVYTLRLRLRFHEEMPLAVEACTLGGVALFLSVEMFLLRAYLPHMYLFYVFAVLGLIVSAAALYGPMATSLLSRLLVDLMIPAERSKTHEPFYGLAEALERDSDFKGALREYMVIARMFPKDVTTLMRIGDLYTKLTEPEQAAHWFERALTHEESHSIEAAERALNVTNRLHAIYRRDLERPHDALRVLKEYADRYPDGEHTERVRQRIERLREAQARESEAAQEAAPEAAPEAVAE